MARERLHDAWVEFLDDLARDRPVVLLIEDVHWADDQLCDLIDTLVAQVSGPLLVLVTARPELLDRRPAWGGAWDRTSAMRLDALPPADTGRLLGELLGADIPEQIREPRRRTRGRQSVLRRGADRHLRRPRRAAAQERLMDVWAAASRLHRAGLRPGRPGGAHRPAARCGKGRPCRPPPSSVAHSGPDRCTSWSAGRGRTSACSRSANSCAVVRPPPCRASASTPSSTPSPGRWRTAASRGPAAHSCTPTSRHGWIAGWMGATSWRRWLRITTPRPCDRRTWTSPGRGGRARSSSCALKAVTWLRKAADLAIGRYEIDDGISLLRRAVELEPDRAEPG